MYPETCKTNYTHHPDRWGKGWLDGPFTCRHCQAHVPTQPGIAGVKNRNHCPYCLWSRHVDHHEAGDRLSACKDVMQPIGLSVKPGHNKYGQRSSGELMLIHRCQGCGKLSINRLAADDIPEKLMDIYRSSFRMDTTLRNELAVNHIRLLQGGDNSLIRIQLHGIAQ